MKVYQDMCKVHKTFRERSENADLAVEVSLQPWRAFQPDGVILFSDILTPITGMNIPFDIMASKGPVIFDPIRTQKQVDAVTELNPEDCVPYVGEALRRLREEVGGGQSTVLGFVGAPFTLATYIVEGGMSKNYTHIKQLMFSNPDVLHGLLQKLADAVVTYIKYQADNGAQVCCCELVDGMIYGRCRTGVRRPVHPHSIFHGDSIVHPYSILHHCPPPLAHT